MSNATRTRLRAAWEVLSTVDTENPDALDRVLGHPFIRVWAVRSLGQLESPATTVGAELDYMSALAASAAIQAGITTEISMPSSAVPCCCRPSGVWSPGRTGRAHGHEPDHRR